jgi:hypothetical protein
LLQIDEPVCSAQRIDVMKARMDIEPATQRSKKEALLARAFFRSGFVPRQRSPRPAQDGSADPER